MGDINGVIVAGGNIGDPQDDFSVDGIYSYGNFNAAVLAPNTASDPNGGNITNVTAWGQIAGSLIAADAVGTVQSGAAVTASISPAATVIENDTGLTSGTIPAVPASSAPAILTDAAAAKAEVLADLAALDAVFVQSKGDAALVLTETADKINVTHAAVQNAVTEAAATAVTNLGTAQTNSQNSLNKSRRDAQSDTNQFAASFQPFAIQLTTYRAEQVEVGEMDHGAAVELSTSIQSNVTAFDLRAIQARDEAIQNGVQEQQQFEKGFTEERVRLANWIEILGTETVVVPGSDPTQGFEVLVSWFTDFADEHNLWIRGMAVLQIAGGISETLIGAELAGLGVIGTGGSLGAGSPVTVPEGILGVLLIVHGGDHVVAGWQTFWTGRYHRTNTSRLLDSITGDPRISEALDGILGAAGSLSAARQILSRTGAWREVAKQADNFVDDAARSAGKNSAPKAGDFGLSDIVEKASGMKTGPAGKFFGWKGRGVTKGASDFTKKELIEKGFTKEVLEQMADAYEKIARTVSTKTGLPNFSAPSRAQQLREILETLF